MKFIRQYWNLLAIFIISALCLLYFNNIFFRHEHLIEGNIITHAHPYPKSHDPFQEHDHTKKELFLYDLIISIIVLLPGLLLLSFYIKVIAVLKNLFYVSSPDLRIEFSLKLRSPPDLFYFPCCR